MPNDAPPDQTEIFAGCACSRDIPPAHVIRAGGVSVEMQNRTTLGLKQCAERTAIHDLRYFLDHRIERSEKSTGFVATVNADIARQIALRNGLCDRYSKADGTRDAAREKKMRAQARLQTLRT